MGFGSVAGGTRAVVARLAQSGEVGQHAVEKEAEPRALAGSCAAHPIHPVVPVARPEERKPVRADGRASFDRAYAVVEHRAIFCGDARRPVHFVFIVREQRRLQKRYAFIEDTRVTGCSYVFGDDVRQPEQIVGTTRAESTAGRLVPPVLHVAFGKLPSCGAKEVLARKVRPCERQCHHVLQLIAKAKRAAGLVIPASRPQPAADGLIEQPSVHQRVKRIVGRADLDGGEGGIPRRVNARARVHRRVNVSVTRDQLARVIAIGAFAQ